MNNRRLRSAKPQRNQQLTRFLETFNRFETAYAKCQQPNIRSKHKLLLFERRHSEVHHHPSILTGDEPHALQPPPCIKSTRSARAQSAKGSSLDNILLRVSTPSTPNGLHKSLFSQSMNRYKKDWSESTLPALAALYRAKCADLKVECNSKQEQIFVSRLESKLTPRQFVCPENGFGLESARVIAKFIRERPSLVVLVLDRNSLGDKSASVIARALPSSNIVKLSLVSTNISWSGAADIFDSLYRTDRLAELSMASCEGLYRNKLGLDGVMKLEGVLKQVETLHMLDLSGSSISPEGWRVICEGMSKNRSLCSLSVAKNELKSEAFSQCIAQLCQSQLQKLDVSRNSIQDQGVVALSDIINGSQSRRCLGSTLRILDLKDNNITSIGLEYLCRQLIKNFSLERLILDRNNLSKGNRFQIFRLLLQSTKSLTYLSIRSVSLEQDDYLYLGEGMEYNTSLQELDMSENYLQRTAFVQVCQAIRHNRVLRVLHLSKCNVSDEGVPHLAEAIDQHHTLEKLYLSHNFIKDSGARRLEILLVKNPQLTVVHLEKNMVSLQSQRDIRRSLGENSLASALGGINMSVYDLKEEDNSRRRAELCETIAGLQRKYEQVYRRNLQEEILYLQCMIEQAERRLKHEEYQLQVLSKIGSFYTTS